MTQCTQPARFDSAIGRYRAPATHLLDAPYHRYVGRPQLNHCEPINRTPLAQAYLPLARPRGMHDLIVRSGIVVLRMKDGDRVRLRGVPREIVPDFVRLVATARVTHRD